MADIPVPHGPNPAAPVRRESLIYFDRTLGRLYVVHPDGDRILLEFGEDDLRTVSATIVGPLDAFNRVSVSQTRSLVDAKFDVEDELGITWFEELDTGGTTTLDTDASLLAIRIGDGASTADGDHAIRRTRVTPYLPAQSKQFWFSFSFGEAVAAANVQKDLGLFDDSDGIILRQTSSGVSLLIRDSTSGSVVETNAVTQANWDDPMDGTGVSKKTIDWTKKQVMTSLFQWLGSGDVFVFFEIDGQARLVHTFANANATNGRPYMATAVLPLSAEVKASGGAVATSQGFDLICCSAQSAGVDRALVQEEIATTGITQRSAGTGGMPVVSIRPNTARVPLEPALVDLMNVDTTSAAYWELVFNGTITGASWVTATGDTHHDYDTTGTSISGGRVVASGFVPAGGSNKTQTAASQNLGTRLRLGIDMDATADTLSLVVYGIGAAADVHGSIECVSYHG